MTRERLPPQVRSFLSAHIKSIEQLEILLLLLREPERWWSADSLAKELRTSPASAAARLEEMASKNFLDVRITEELFYRYGPVSASLDGSVREAARAYKETPVAVTTAIYSSGLDDIRGFADAFRIRKRHGEGDDG